MKVYSIMAPSLHQDRGLRSGPECCLILFITLQNEPRTILYGDEAGGEVRHYAGLSGVMFYHHLIDSPANIKARLERRNSEDNEEEFSCVFSRVFKM